MDHASREQLNAGLDHVRASPREQGPVQLIVRRPAIGEREIVAEAVIDAVDGLAGDCWRFRGSSTTADGEANPEAQITLMNARSAALIAVTADRWPLAGDQLFVDLDLGVANLPPGTRLQVGSAVVEVTALPHRGCGKFLARFGLDASRFVNSPAGRELNLRGINAKVVAAGAVRCGEMIRKVDAAHQAPGRLSSAA